MNSNQITGRPWPEPEPMPTPTTVPEILEKMATTFRDRNATYGENWRNVGPVMAALFPSESTVLVSAADYEMWHLFELIVVKLTRFATSGLEHRDSIHDIAVYAAMIEAVLKERD